MFYSAGTWSPLHDYEVELARGVFVNRNLELVERVERDLGQLGITLAVSLSVSKGHLDVLEQGSLGRVSIDFPCMNRKGLIVSFELCPAAECNAPFKRNPTCQSLTIWNLSSIIWRFDIMDLTIDPDP